MEHRNLNRRDFLQLSAAAVTGTIAAACAPAAPQIVEKVVKETVVVEKEIAVEKEVIKEVPVEKVVEKEIVKEVPVEKVVEKEVIKEVPVKPAGPVWVRVLGGDPTVWVNTAYPKFKEDHPDINVSQSPGISFEKILAMLVAKDAPDIFSGWGSYLPTMAQRGMLLDLAPLIDRDYTMEDLQKWNQPVLKFFQKYGLWYALPLYTGTGILYCNYDAFDDAGLDRPPTSYDDNWNHDDYYDILVGLTKRDASGKIIRWGHSWWVGGAIVDWRMLHHMAAWGGHMVDPEDDTHCLLAEPEAQEAWWWMHRLMWEDNASVQPGQTDQGGINAVVTGVVGVNEDGSWTMNRLVEHSEFKWNVAPFPEGPAGVACEATMDGWVIWKETKVPEAAWEVHKFLVGEWYSKHLIDEFQRQPAHISLLPYYYQTLREQWPITEDVALEECIGAPLAEGIAIPGELFKKHADSEEILKAASERILQLGKETPDALKEACEEVTKLNRAAD